MAWEEEGAEEEHEEEMEASEEEGEDVVVGQMPTFMVPKHINKRALKNKALAVSLDKKALKYGTAAASDSLPLTGSILVLRRL